MTLAWKGYAPKHDVAQKFLPLELVSSHPQTSVARFGDCSLSLSAALKNGQLMAHKAKPASDSRKLNNN